MPMFLEGHQEEERTNYTTIERIGRGGFGNVYPVRPTTGKKSLP